MPDLSIAGDVDRFGPLAETRAFQRAVPSARTVILEGCGHLVMVESPLTLTRYLIAFSQALG